MIRLQRGGLGKRCEQRLERLTTELEGYLARNEPLPEGFSRKYNTVAVKRQLLKESFDKCAYCETKILSIHAGHIDHIIPQSIDRRRVFCYYNLVIGCEKCNLSKGNSYDEEEPHVNPYMDDPKEHIGFYGSEYWDIDDKGLATLAAFDLNRDRLISQRKRHMKLVVSSFRRWRTAKSERIRQKHMSAIVQMMSPEEEYSALTNAMVESTPGVRAGVTVYLLKTSGGSLDPTS